MTTEPQSQSKTVRASRREILTGATIAAATVSVASAAVAQPQPPAAARTQPPGAGLGSGPMSRIFWQVNTSNGPIEGMAQGDVKIFLGVPYGAPTGGRNRYMPPRKPTPWRETLNCIGYRPISPQTKSALGSDYSQMIMWDRHVGDGGMGEDCLVLNVWTRHVNDGAKRPVLVSYHGGGWTTGSGNGPMYDGGQLARLDDVVVVTVNHRLGALGYLHLADLGAPAEFADAGNVGVMDMVASLEWVRDNIEKFGGDPKKVMIFGQSGGGSKTSTLLATPSAKGLFTRAAVQSGSTLRQGTKESQTQAAETFLRNLGINKDWRALQDMPWQRLLEAQTRGGGFRPVVDGRVLPHHPFDPAAPQESADVPVIISTTLHDSALSLTNFDLTEAQLGPLFTRTFGPKGGDILKAYRAKNPRQSPYLVQAEAFTDRGRGNSMIQAERKAALNRAPAYMYVWDWANPSFGGKFGAVHGHDVDASFHLYRNPMCGSGSAEGRRVCDAFARTWVAFADTGNPNNPAIPNWPAYEARNRATMVIDTNTRVVNNYRGDMVKMIADALPTAPRPSFV